MKRTLIYIVVAGVIFMAGGIIGSFFMACMWIGNDVKNQCSEVVQLYGGDCVTALASRVADETQSFRDRNSAIWALGQLGDKRALPTLQMYYTGDIPVREPLDKTISQYELKKAVNLASGGPNITAVFWRYNINK